MHLIEGPADGRFAIYTKFHRALAEGVAAIKMLRRHERVALLTG